MQTKHNLTMTLAFAEWSDFFDRLMTFHTKSGRSVRVLVRHEDNHGFSDPEAEEAQGWIHTGRIGLWMNTGDDWGGLFEECGLTQDDILDLADAHWNEIWYQRTHSPYWHYYPRAA